ncbi:hypothetical protein ACIGMX_16130 [Streptomyces aquilus]|uniref:hypothetical protein n=1 Tax=Streptomyces aquilus TaxID=2548456 RepID=UPI0037D77C2B
MSWFAGTGTRRYTRARLIHDRDAARAEVLRLEGVLREADALVHRQVQQLAQLQVDAVDVGVERRLRTAAEERAARLDEQLTALRSRVANEHAVTVPPMHRDVDPDERPTEPGGIDVRTLREALNPTAA